MERPDPHQTLKEFMAQHGLKSSRQRDTIVDVFLQAGGHLKVDELLAEVRKIDPKVSQATVYRTMKLLSECGLATARNFHDGQTRYERSEVDAHHDHIICTECDKIVEFVDPRIERLQSEVAREYGFVVTEHKMELYGLCASCRTDKSRDGE